MRGMLLRNRAVDRFGSQRWPYLIMIFQDTSARVNTVIKNWSTFNQDGGTAPYIDAGNGQVNYGKHLKLVIKLKVKAQ